MFSLTGIQPKPMVKGCCNKMFVVRTMTNVETAEYQIVKADVLFLFTSNKSQNAQLASWLCLCLVACGKPVTLQGVETSWIDISFIINYDLIWQ